MLQFCSVNYICQVCKLYFYLGNVQILENIYIWVFLVNNESVLLLAFVKYMLYSHCTENCMFLYFSEVKNPYFVTKNYSESSYICVFILSKKFHNSRTVGCRKLPDPSLNHIFKGSFKKYVGSKLPAFDPLLPLFVPVPAGGGGGRGGLWWVMKREKRITFYVKSTWKINVFYTVIYAITIQIFTCS